jgi:uncharacterized secreted protein with C-terminal beta-propeller domain
MKGRLAACAAVLALLAGCTAAPKPVAHVRPPVAEPQPALHLAAADSCAALMDDLRAAARPWALPQRGAISDAAPGPAPGAAPDAAKADGTADPPDYSRTNTAELYADEPDLVKTDGRRIVAISHGVLTVVDARTRQVTGTLDLPADTAQPTGLLFAGDRVLVLFANARLMLVDLSDAEPVVASEYTMDGALVDARQMGTVVRVVVRTWPRPDDWLPRYSVTARGRITTGRVDCGRVRLPAQYSGTTMLSLLTFDLGEPALSDGDPLTIVADGQTVYANGTSLYVANGNQWLGWPRFGVAAPRQFVHQTELYQFDISGTGTPAYVAAGTVSGWVINQYALSEWNGYLRVATTLDEASSTVAVLGRDGGLLRPVGSVGGLGRGQRIYAVRFAGPVGYVVTFRQTDPLYTLDLRDPAHPAVTGQVELDGYSAYLHPAGDGRLIGVGQASTNQGRNLGVQVSLFDVADPTRPARLARYDLPGSGHSLAEFDPHAFLFWPATGLLVVPLRAGGLALRVTGTALVKAGDLRGGALLRSLVVGTTLWTLTTGGLAASDLAV